MTEDIDIKKLTDDAFMAIDALFTDEESDIFAEEKDKEPDDFILIQEYMLAIEWECSDKNIKKFNDFLNKITPKYSGKHNQDVLKMLLSIVRYLEKAKDKALPETHNVMESIVKTFKSINQEGVDEAAIKQDKNNAYNKVLDLKSKIAKVKAETPQVSPEPSYLKENQYEEKVSATLQQPSEQVVLPPQQLKSNKLETSYVQTTSQQSTDLIDNSKIINIITRLDFCENRLASMEAQQIKLQQQIYEITNLNKQTNDQINRQMSELDFKLSDKISELSQTIYSLNNSTKSINSDFRQDAVSDDKALFDNSITDDQQQYQEVSFDGLDFDEMPSYMDSQQIAANEINADKAEIQLSEVGLDEIEIDFEKFDKDSNDSLESYGDNTHEKNAFKEDEDFEEILSDDIEYEDITPDLIEYDDTINSEPQTLDGSKTTTANSDDDNKTVFAESLNNNNADNGSKKDQNLPTAENILKSSNNSDDIIEGEIPKYVRCFRIGNQTVAVPDDKLYNIYKIPSKLNRAITQMPIIALGEFSSLFQNLSKNMKGHLNSVSNSTLKKMNVDVRLLTTQTIQYKIALLCSFEDKVSIIPVSNIYDDRSHPLTEIKKGHNAFSDYNVNIVDIGLIPFLPFSKK